ncbi:hypothetical protein M9Y10_043818 [Tritrichomonas musculus]|uniref:Protein kinase domain-containing protein n=1 Tax=Tritrichomonas musculus TaxID=1915356 RepID=A0ABR2K0R0_9EUKA
MSKSIYDHVSPILQKFIVKYDDFKIGKLIGQGAYGKVYYAIHKPTQKKCAVKKLFIQEMAGPDLVSYCREVEVLVKCDNAFVLPFYGWSATFPYIIITQHIPNGSLFSALHHRPQAPTLSATNKTLIAIGIASGMASLHSVGIIHRDLKSLNILLDEEMLPKIGDFGLSRFQDDEISQMTADVGTPHWMAPELFESTNYTNKVDVYAFGMLMWEMYNEDAPFHGMNSVQIAFQVSKEGYRPPWPADTPEEFKSFVNLCWHQNPNKRPEFKQIYKYFIQKKIYFPGTDLEFVDTLRADITIDERRRLKNESNRIPPLFVPSEIQRRPPTTYDSVTSHPETSDFETLPNPSSSKFAEKFTKNINYITKENVSDFFKSISTCLSGNGVGVPDDTMIMILRELHKILSDPDRLTVYLNLDYHKMLPIQSVCASNLSLLLLLDITTRRPDVVDISFMHAIEPAIVSHPDKVLSIVAPFFKKFDTQKENQWQVLDFIIKNCEPFLLGAGEKFIHTIYYLSTTYKDILNARFDYFVNIINFALTLRDVGTVRSAYQFASKFYTERFTVKSKLMISHIDDHDLRKYALSFLVKEVHVEVQASLINALIRAAPYEKVAIGMLNNYLSSSLDLCKLFMQSANKWMLSASLETGEIVGFVLILASYQTLRESLASIPELADVLSAMADSGDIKMVDLTAHLILKMMPSKKLIINLGENGFFPIYFNAIRTIKTRMITAEFLMVIGILVSFNFVPDFVNFIPFIIGLSRNSDLKTEAVFALKSLALYPKCEAAIKKEYERIKNANIKKSQSQPFDNAILDKA